MPHVVRRPGGGAKSQAESAGVTTAESPSKPTGNRIKHAQGKEHCLNGFSWHITSNCGLLS